MSFSKVVVREFNDDVRVVNLLSRLRTRFASVLIEVDDVVKPLAETVDFTFVPEDDGRALVGEALEVDDISLPIDWSSACKLDSADARAFFSFWTRSRNYQTPSASTTKLPKYKNRQNIPSEDSASSTSSPSLEMTSQSHWAASLLNRGSSARWTPERHCRLASEANAEGQMER